MKLVDVTKTGGTFERELSEHKFKELLTSHTRNTHDAVKRVPIFTDLQFKHRLALITPSAKEAKTPFWLDKIVQSFGSWGRFPSRRNFLRAYTSMDKVGDETTVIIPFDGAKLGICGGSTFYKSFDAVKALGFDKLDNDTLSQWMTTVATGLNKVLKTEIATDEIQSMGAFTKYLQTLTNAIDRLKLQRELGKADDITDAEHTVLRDILRRYTTSMDLYMREKLDPDQNGFILTRAENILKHSGDHEVWLDQPCLAIRRRDYIELLSKDMT